MSVLLPAFDRPTRINSGPAASAFHQQDGCKKPILYAMHAATFLQWGTGRHKAKRESKTLS
eukprot:1498934-Amphidinium_carterae.1